MNFGYKETIEKQKDLVSIQKKVMSKSLVSVLKVFLYMIFLLVLTGGFLGIGVIHGIVKSAPVIEDVSSIMPSSYSSTVYDANNKQIANKSQPETNPQVFAIIITLCFCHFIKLFCQIP